LNRIGIILNFCAGFMVAPELLRVERLRWIEEGIEKVLARFQKFANANRVLSPIKKLYLVGYIVVFISFTVITLAKRNGDDTLPNYLTVPAPFVIVISVCVVGVIVATLLVALLLDYVAGKLAGDDRLRSILVWWGIVFFIVGNLLQFISTF